jgi:pullulanase-type alpha-1,6-glucosidase
LQQLAQSGLTHVHLLPTFDIATIDENKANWVLADSAQLATFPPDSEEQQALLNLNRDQDAFNWGYDPFHYNVPEGSYSTNPDGTQRILEYRQMVAGLNNIGLRVVIDVVYNHTNASGQSEKSVLDRIVPGYYHRLTDTGRVANSTCCANTATEHDMMRKLMVDSVVLWATQYKVDGFRFDLMGHHMTADMQAVRDALDALTLEADGVDGKSIVLYGEGWDFGEVAGGIRGENATQLNVGGMGIGTFNDRIRDAVRGGNPFGGQQEQGFATGLWSYPNATDTRPEGLQKVDLLHRADQIRVALAGNLADFSFENMLGEIVTGKEVDYNGAPAGYTQQPQEVINYVSAHDNETLFDAVQFKAPTTATMAERVAMQNMALSVVMLGQGIPFFHAGSEILRSKSFDRDSYNSGDWFNAIDWTYGDNNWGHGLPVADKNQDSWGIMQPLLADPNLAPDQAAIMANLNHFQRMLRVRQSSPLFRLQTAEQVQQKLSFLNTGADQIPGLIVMWLDDRVGAEVDGERDGVLVMFNATNEVVEFTLPAEMPELSLHPELALLSDSTLRGELLDGVAILPPMSTTVLVAPQNTVTGGGENDVLATPEASADNDVAESGQQDAGTLRNIFFGAIAALLVIVGGATWWQRRNG